MCSGGPSKGSRSRTTRSPRNPSRMLPLRCSTRLAQADPAYTAGSAWANRVEHLSGSIREGFRGDLVVLDRDPFDGPPEHIARARVARTYVDGRLVHRSE